MDIHRRKAAGLAHWFEKYRFSVGRYSCYPTSERFASSFRALDMKTALAARARVTARRPLALAVHLGGHGADSAAYLDGVRREAGLLASLAGGEKPRAIGIHGADAALVASGQLPPLVDFLRNAFGAAEIDMLIEIDAKQATHDTLRHLAACRFDRLRLRCGDAQDAARFAAALEDATDDLGMRPDVSICHGGDQLDAPGCAALIAQAVSALARCIVLAGTESRALHRPAAAALLGCAIETLCGAGYENAGFDVFVRRGQRGAGPFHLRFDVFGLGAGAVTASVDCYAMNAPDAVAYLGALDAGQLPVSRGHRMTADDLVRRDVIHSLECLGNVSFSSIEFRHGLDFQRYFASELHEIEEMQQDGLVELYEDAIEVTPEGRPLTRLAASVFDRYLQQDPITESRKRQETNSFT